jgi:hypothetical protein
MERAQMLKGRERKLLRGVQKAGGYMCQEQSDACRYIKDREKNERNKGEKVTNICEESERMEVNWQ